MAAALLRFRAMAITNTSTQGFQRREYMETPPPPAHTQWCGPWSQEERTYCRRRDERTTTHVVIEIIYTLWQHFEPSGADYWTFGKSLRNLPMFWRFFCLHHHRPPWWLRQEEPLRRLPISTRLHESNIPENSHIYTLCNENLKSQLRYLLHISSQKWRSSPPRIAL
jgi:hypothetical protein